MKKKRIHGNRYLFGDLPKILRTMKLICLFMFVALVQVSASGYSQNTKLNLSGQNLTLEKVFELIEEQSEFSFIYNLNQIDLSQKVDIDFKNERVEKILDQILSGTQITYTVNNRLIVVHREGKSDLQEIFSVQQKSVSGKITDVKGKKINMDPPGSGTAMTADVVFEAFGIKRSDLALVNELKSTEGPTMLQDNHIDGYFFA
ncbi:MAG: hypothetical protein EOM73_08590, partial [Bacteroidia bacterium]|nr:hypothetical protein [Bacteroidia bacterium]